MPHDCLGSPFQQTRRWKLRSLGVHGVGALCVEHACPVFQARWLEPATSGAKGKLQGSKGGKAGKGRRRGALDVGACFEDCHQEILEDLPRPFLRLGSSSGRSLMRFFTVSHTQDRPSRFRRRWTLNPRMRSRQVWLGPGVLL